MDYCIVKIFSIVLVALSDQSYVLSHQLEIRENNTDLPDLVLQFCPVQCKQESFLNRQGLNSFENKCCIPCDCNVSCFAARTCCADIQTGHEHMNLTSATDMLGETCVKTAIGDSKINSYDVKDVDTYMLIQVCSNGSNGVQNTGSDIITKCLQPDGNVLEELIPVYSNVTGRNYRNKFCALCNEDNSSIVPWKSQLTCIFYELAMRLFPWSAEKNANGVILQTLRENEGCIIRMSSDKDRAKHCIDQDDVISKCNISVNYRPELVNLCQEIYSPVRGLAGIYKNVFCLRCNEGDSVLHSTCESSFTPVYQQTFSVFLSPEAYGPYPDKLQQDGSLICKNGMTYDYYLKRCISKRCPISHMKVGDSCLPMFQKVKGVSFDHRFKLVYQRNCFILPSTAQIMSEIRHLVLHDASFELCQERIIEMKNEGDLVILRIQLIKSPVSDKLHDIYEDFQTVQYRIKLLNELSAEGFFAYTVELDDTFFEPIYGEFVSLINYGDYIYSETCGVMVAISIMQFCDTVLVNDYDLMKDGTVLVDGNIRFSPGEYVPMFINESMFAMDIKSILICYDLYISRGSDGLHTMVKNNLTNMTSASNSMKSLTLLTLLLFIFLRQ